VRSGTFYVRLCPALGLYVGWQVDDDFVPHILFA